MSLEILYIGKADGLRMLEGNMQMNVKKKKKNGECICASPGSENQAC